MNKCITALLLTALSWMGVAQAALDPIHQDELREFEERMGALRGKYFPGREIKIQDLVEIVGEEAVKLTGFGVVTGLNGTGDSGKAAIDMILTVADKLGIRLEREDIKEKNVALVAISAEVTPHQRRFDVAVKSIGDAKSLQNGYLEGSTLHPIGSEDVFGVASGPLALGARYFAAAPAAGATGGASAVTLGHPTVGNVVDGGQLVQEIPSLRQHNGRITLFLKHPDNRTAANISNVINDFMRPLGVRSEPTNASTITVLMDDPIFNQQGPLTRLIADIGDLVVPVARKATITVDQSSGVIAMNGGVKLEPGSIAIAGLTVVVSSDISPVTRQGATDGFTAFYDQPELEVSEDLANFLTVPAGTDLRKVQETLNALKLAPTSIISVFSSMHEAGMIHADLVVLPR